MNETIGARGGHNDRKRSLIIRKQQKLRLIAEREEKEIKELESRVKKQQKFTLIKTLPIVIAHETIKTFFSTPKASQIDKKAQVPENNNKEKQIVILDNSNKKIVTTIKLEINEEYFKKSKSEKRQEEQENSKTIKKEEPEEKENCETKEVKPKISTISNEENNKTDYIQSMKKNTCKTVEVFQDFIPMPIHESEKVVSIRSDLDEEKLTDNQLKKLNKLKTRKLIDEYQKQLKDIRYDLRNLIFEYNILVEESQNAKLSSETEIILDKLSFIINKLEELKRKIEIENLDKYDDNYIYTLVEGYLEEFKDKRVVQEIKDSPLYITISEKLEELDDKKYSLQKKVDDKKEQLEIKEEKFEKLKEKYFNVEQINKSLLDFQYEQDQILKEVREKVKNAISIQEKVEVQITAMNRQTKKIFKMLRRQLLFPGFRSGRSMATTAAAYLYFVNNILNPQTTTKKYKVITVKDYSKDLENNINNIMDAKNILNKTSKQIDKMLKEITEEFKDYLGVIKEADELLSNLKRMKQELKEKEYEMDRIKKEQEKVLETNNQKVKKKGEYPM